MTSISTATADWLALRAPADTAARSAGLARALARLIEAEPGGAGAGEAAAGAMAGSRSGAHVRAVVVHDLGAGTGSMTRWLAPRLPGPQRWVLRDGDAGILSHLDLGSVVDDAGRPVTAQPVVEQLGELPPDAFQGATAVTASALLDVVTHAEAERIVAACVATGTPALFSLNVTGEVTLHPSPRADAGLERAIGAAFNDHQRRDAGGRRMLGPDAVPVVAGLFAAAGWHVRTAATPWRLGAADGALAAEWLDGWVDAAAEQRPDLAAAAEGYHRRRRPAAAAGRLRITVSHEDLLAWPR